MYKQILAIVFGTSLLVGCATSGPNKGKVTTDSAAPAIKVAAYGGTYYALKSNPELKAKFQDVADSLAVIEKSETLDWAVVLAAVNKLPIKELQGKDASVIITGSMILLNQYAGPQTVPVDQYKDDIHSVVKALREGIELGLQ